MTDSAESESDMIWNVAALLAFALLRVGST